MRLSAPSLVRRAHNSHTSIISSTSVPSLDSSSRSGDRHHSSHHHGDSHCNIARRSFVSFWKNHLFVMQSKKACTTSISTGRRMLWLTLCTVFFLLSMGKISAPPSFRRAHSSSTSTSTLLSTFSYDANDNNNLRSHVQKPHSIRLFSGHFYDNSTSHHRPPISRASSTLSSRVVLPNYWGLPKNKTADFGLLEIELLFSKSKMERSIQNETEDGAAAMNDDMEDRIAFFMTGWDDSSDAARHVVAPVLSRREKRKLNISSHVIMPSISSQDAQQPQEQPKDCQRVSWHKTVYPNCNTFHELDLATVLLDETSAYIGYVVYTLPILFFRATNMLSLLIAIRHLLKRSHDTYYALCSLAHQKLQWRLLS
jgi:hypothetical protein